MVAAFVYDKAFTRSVYWELYDIYVFCVIFNFQWATLKTKWRRLKEEGILEDCLIDHMWQDLLPQKPALLALMEMFDLLCPRLDAVEVRICKSSKTILINDSTL